MGNILRHGIETYQKTMNQPKPAKGHAKGPAEGLIKTTQRHGKHKPVVTDNAKTMRQDSKIRRVAKFLILIGSDYAASILSGLEPEQIEEISREITFVRTIKPEEAAEIIAEFENLFSSIDFKFYKYSGLSRGGIETARRILYAAKGPEKGEALLNKAVPASRDNIFSFLEEFSAEQLMMLLKTESAQTSALVLSRLPPKHSAEIINRLPAGRKAEVLLRVAHQDKVLPEVLEQVAAALKEKVRNITGGAKDIEINGMQTLAAILKQGDYAFSDRIINELEDNSPDIGKELKEKLYTLDDVILTIDRPIQDKLTTMSERDIAVLLKGRGLEFCEKIMSCVSAGRRQLIREESEILGAVPKRECDAVAKEFLAWFRIARENGDIILYSDEDVFL